MDRLSISAACRAPGARSQLRHNGKMVLLVLLIAWSVTAHNRNAPEADSGARDLLARTPSQLSTGYLRVALVVPRTDPAWHSSTRKELARSARSTPYRRHGCRRALVAHPLRQREPCHPEGAVKNAPSFGIGPSVF